MYIKFLNVFAVILALSLSSCTNSGEKLPISFEYTYICSDFTTNYGTISLRLNKSKTPGTVENFMRYVDEGFYNNTVFHFVTANQIQAGGYNENYILKSNYGPIANESYKGLSNVRGTVAMANTSNSGESATSQFFINITDNTHLDYSDAEIPPTWGSAVFGEVMRGMEVADTISQLQTGAVGPFQADAPLNQVIITSADRAACP